MPGQPEVRRSPGRPPGTFTVRELRLPAKASELRRAREYVDGAAASFGFGDAERFEVVFAVNEALTNAIAHGTADENGTIGLRIAADGDRLTLDVCDHGRFLAPAPGDGPMRDHGRGLQLMAELMDDVEVRARPEGTIVRLVKRRRTGSNGSRSDRG